MAQTRAELEAQGYKYLSTTAARDAAVRSGQKTVNIGGNLYIVPTTPVAQAAPVAPQSGGTVTVTGPSVPAPVVTAPPPAVAPNAAVMAPPAIIPDAPAAPVVAAPAAPVAPAQITNRAQAQAAGYQYLGTQQGVKDAITKYGRDRVKQIGGNYYVIPKDVKNPSFNNPIPGGALSAESQSHYDQLGKILGTTVTPDMIPSDIAGILALGTASTEADRQVQSIQKDLTDALGSLGQEGADLQAEMDKQGVGANFEMVKQLNLKLAQLAGEIQSFDVETQQQSSNIENQPIPQGLIVGQQAALQRQRDITRMAKAAELSATSALSQAYKGNADLGLELAQKSIDLKYRPLEARINQLKTQLGFAMDNMSKADQQRANVINAIMTERQNTLNAQKEKESEVMSIAVKAAASGAPLSVVNAIKAASDPAEAASIGGKYLSGDYGDIQKVAAQAAANGAPANVVKAMKNAPDSATAAQIGNKYLKGNNEKVAGGKGSGAGSGKPPAPAGGGGYVNVSKTQDAQGGLAFYGKNKSTGKSEPIGAAVYARKSGQSLDKVLSTSKNEADKQLVKDIKEARAQGDSDDQILEELRASGRFNHLFVGW